MRAYLASATFADAMVGRVLDALEKSPYADGSEELYNHDDDPNEWTNLADHPQYAPVRQRLVRWLGRQN